MRIRPSLPILLLSVPSLVWTACEAENAAHETTIPSAAGGSFGRGGAATLEGGNANATEEGLGGGVTAGGGQTQSERNAGGSMVSRGTEAGGELGGGASDAGASTGGTGGGGQGGTGAAGQGGTGAAGQSNAGAGGAAGTCVESTCGSHKWACWKMPNPAGSPATVPNHQSYTDLGNGAIRDNITCLVWEKVNPADKGDWQKNADRCTSLATSNYAGFNDWRMPTRVEMASIVDVTRGTTGYPAVFTVTSWYYDTSSWWYETITGASSDKHWGYGTNGFTSNAVAISGANVTRCVRGNGLGEAADQLAVEPPNHYTISGTAPNAEVLDNYTGLIWQQGYSPSLLALEDASAYCSVLSLNGHTGWRVPTLNELASTVNEALVGGAINSTAFPNNPNGCKDPKYWFWAAEASKVGGTAWGLSYCDGFTGTNSGASGAWNYFPTANVRCVR